MKRNTNERSCVADGESGSRNNLLNIYCYVYPQVSVIISWREMQGNFILPLLMCELWRTGLVNIGASATMMNTVLKGEDKSEVT